MISSGGGVSTRHSPSTWTTVTVTVYGDRTVVTNEPSTRR
jgi:hypothetical protein